MRDPLAVRADIHKTRPLLHWTPRAGFLYDGLHTSSTRLLDRERLLNQHGLTVTERRYSLGLYAYTRLDSNELKWQRRRLLRWARHIWPRLFGFQFVWSATRRVEP